LNEFLWMPIESKADCSLRRKNLTKFAPKPKVAIAYTLNLATYILVVTFKVILKVLSSTVMEGIV